MKTSKLINSGCSGGLLADSGAGLRAKNQILRIRPNRLGTFVECNCRKISFPPFSQTTFSCKPSYCLPAFQSIATAPINTGLFRCHPLHSVVPGVPSPKSLKFRRRPVGCFSRRERRAYLDRYVRSGATRKKQPTGHGPEGCVENRPAGCVARRLRIHSDMRPPRALPAAYFERNETQGI